MSDPAINISKGTQTQTAILEAAGRILIDVGYTDFTLRKVAAEAGLSIGNLNYHYPKKSDLVDALLDYLTERIIEGINQASASAGDEPEARLRAVLNYWIDDLQSIETSVLFPEIWSLANHYGFAQATMARSYSHGLATLIELIPPLNPELPAAEVERIAKFMCAAMEGLTIFVGHKKMWADDHTALKETAIESFIALIQP